MQLSMLRSGDDHPCLVAEPIDAALEIGAYEALWREQDASFASIAARLRRSPGARPSHLVPEDQARALVAKRVWPDLPSHRLNVVSKHLGIRLKHHDALSDARAAGLIVTRAIEETGIPLEGWLSPARGKQPPAPTPAPAGPLAGQRIAILGEPRHGPLAHRLAALGGRIMASVGKTATMLVVMAHEPFGYIRYDGEFRAAHELQQLGSGIEIVSAAALANLHPEL